MESGFEEDMDMRYSERDFVEEAQEEIDEKYKEMKKIIERLKIHWNDWKAQIHRFNGCGPWCA